MTAKAPTVRDVLAPIWRSLTARELTDADLFARVRLHGAIDAEKITLEDVQAALDSRVTDWTELGSTLAEMLAGCGSKQNLKEFSREEFATGCFVVLAGADGWRANVHLLRMPPQDEFVKRFVAALAPLITPAHLESFQSYVGDAFPKDD